MKKYTPPIAKNTSAIAAAADDSRGSRNSRTSSDGCSVLASCQPKTASAPRPPATGPSTSPRSQEPVPPPSMIPYTIRTGAAHRSPGPDELIGGLRIRGQQRGQAEQGHADDQHPAPADPVAHHAEREKQAGEDQGVGVDRPFQLALAGAEPGPRFRDGLK